MVKFEYPDKLEIGQTIMHGGEWFTVAHIDKERNNEGYLKTVVLTCAHYDRENNTGSIVKQSFDPMVKVRVIVR